MTIQNYQLWPFEPNWNSALTETLTWLTDVMTSPTGSEQRRSLRFFPRRSFEFDTVVHDTERTFFDNLIITHGARRWYMPFWYDVNFVENMVPTGAIQIDCSTVLKSKLRVDGIACLMGDSVFDYELVEIETIGAGGVVLKSPTKRVWPKGTRIFAVSVVRLSTQPESKKLNDRLLTLALRSELIEEPVDDGVDYAAASGLQYQYRNFYVLSDPPDEQDELSFNIERMLVEFDNQTSHPIWQDTAMQAFTVQQYAWSLSGRDELYRFEALLQMLRGRAIPIWMPTFMEDFKVRTAIRAVDKILSVERAGFTLSGGPRPDREDIMIELISGEKIFRRITASALNAAGQETLALNDAIGVNIPLNNIARVSFMTLMRLNQDVIEISHETDSDGTTTVITNFRSAPDTRVATPAVF